MILLMSIEAGTLAWLEEWRNSCRLGLHETEAESIACMDFRYSTVNSDVIPCAK